MSIKLKGLKTEYVGRNFCFFDIIDSTQNEIWRRINLGTIKNGTLIMADIQTKGRGTHGRHWHTDEKNNIAFSIFMEANYKIDVFEGLTLDIANIIVQLFKNKYNISIEIKLPNDLMINNKKVGGILTESRIRSGFIKFLIIGIGINTNKLFFTEDIKNLATSIKKEYKIEIDRFNFVTEFCNTFEKVFSERIK